VMDFHLDLSFLYPSGSLQLVLTSLLH